MKRAILVMGLVASIATRLEAQCATPNGAASGTCTSNIATSLTIPTLISLTIDDTSTTLTPPTESAYDATWNAAVGPVATIKTNNTWTLSIRATAATWTATGTGARANKPVGDLMWSKVDNSGTGTGYTALTTSNVQIASGNRGASNVTSIFYRVNWSWPLDTPGTYTLAVVFTATAP